MLTREQVDEAFGDDRNPFTLQRNIDHDATVIALLRSRIPYDVCKGIIGGAEHDKLWLCDIDYVLEYCDEADLAILADCNCWIDGDDTLALFV